MSSSPAEGGHRDQDRRAGAGDARGRGRRFRERQGQIDAVADEPDVDACPPEDAPVDLQAVLEGPEEGQGDDGDAHADAHDEQGLERGEDGGDGAVHTASTVPAPTDANGSPRRDSGPAHGYGPREQKLLSAGAASVCENPER